MRKAFVILVALVAVAATGSLLFLRNRANVQRTAASIGLGLHTPTPSPTPKPGIIALTDVNDLIKNTTPSPLPVQTLEGGLQVQDTLVGTGAEAVAGANVAVDYTGRLEDGTVFDSSIPRKQPFVFVLGTGAVIKGWDLGVAGMKVGGKRTLSIPPALGYGSKGAGGVIPPNATLVFEVELLDVQTK